MCWLNVRHTWLILVKNHSAQLFYIMKQTVLHCKSTICMGQSSHMKMVPMTIFMCFNPISQRLLIEKAVVWKVTSIDFFFFLTTMETTNYRNHGGVSPRKERNGVITGFRRSNALIGSEKSRAVDERVNMKSGLQSRPRVLFPWKPQSEDRCEMMRPEIPYLKLHMGRTSRLLLWVKGLKSFQLEEWGTLLSFLRFQKANFLTV